MDWLTLLAAVFGGSFFGSFLGPLMLLEWNRFRTERPIEKARRKIVNELFQSTELPIVSLSAISTAIGANDADTRLLLIAMGASGTPLPDGTEGWYFNKGAVSFNWKKIEGP